MILASNDATWAAEGEGKQRGGFLLELRCFFGVPSRANSEVAGGEVVVWCCVLKLRLAVLKGFLRVFTVAFLVKRTAGVQFVSCAVVFGALH